MRFNSVRWRTKRPPMTDREVQRRYHPKRPRIEALHPFVYPNPPNYSEFPPPIACRVNRPSPTPPCSHFPPHLGYRRFLTSLPRDSSLQPV